MVRCQFIQNDIIDIGHNMVSLFYCVNLKIVLNFVSGTDAALFNCVLWRFFV